MDHGRISVFVAAFAMLGLAASARAQLGRTYYVRPPSTLQQGCFNGCACWTSDPEPLHGTFVVTPSLPDPVFNNFSISSVNLSAPRLAANLQGSGLFQVGGDPAAAERLQLDLMLNDQPVQHWDSGVSPPRSNSPAINQVVTIHNYQCYDTVLTIHASVFKSDWNTDGVVNVQDIFDFVATWFSGNGDIDADGNTDVLDVFQFIAEWFEGL